MSVCCVLHGGRGRGDSLKWNGLEADVRSEADGRVGALAGLWCLAVVV